MTANQEIVVRVSPAGGAYIYFVRDQTRSGAGGSANYSQPDVAALASGGPDSASFGVGGGMYTVAATIGTAIANELPTLRTGGGQL